ELGREESRRCFQDLVRATQLPVLTLELLEALTFVRRQPWPVPFIDLSPAHPSPHRLGRRAQLLGHRADRVPLRVRMAFALEHHPHRTLTQLGRILPRTSLLWHHSILPTDGACALPGAVQRLVCLRMEHPRRGRRGADIR